MRKPSRRQPTWQISQITARSWFRRKASIGNDANVHPLGFTVLNRMRRIRTDSVKDVWSAYAHNQHLTIPRLRSRAGSLGGN